MHLKKGSVRVKSGDKVKQGDIIGIMSNTGDVSPKPTAANPRAGTHLHFAVKTNSTAWNNGVYVNPIDYLTGAKSFGTVTPPTAPAINTAAVEVNKSAKLLPTAKYYSTGALIPEQYKNRTYTIQQFSIDGKKALLKEIYSWVYTADLVKV